jgi:geranylgeranyl diphosphate synthase, type II
VVGLRLKQETGNHLNLGGVDSSNVTVEDRLQNYRSRSEACLESLLPDVTREPAVLHEAMRYSALAPGKRLRPLLVLAACEAVGGDPETALEAACAVELVHCFSLIHDDLPAIDNDELRRGRPTCHVQFGEGIALLAGDALFALAFSALAKLNAPADRILRCVQILADASGSDGLVGGEVVDILTEGKPFDARTLEFIHSRKTGSLIAGSCEMGAVLGGADAATQRGIHRFGELVGLSFQVIDDILNETSTPEQLGKAAGSDRAREKATFPFLVGLEESERMAGELARAAVAELDRLNLEAKTLRYLADYTIVRVN